METLARWAVRQVPAFDTQNLANMAWAHAKISLKQDFRPQFVSFDQFLCNGIV